MRALGSPARCGDGLPGQVVAREDGPVGPEGGGRTILSRAARSGRKQEAWSELLMLYYLN